MSLLSLGIELARALLNELGNEGWDVQGYERVLDRVAHFMEACPEWTRLLDDALREGIEWARREFLALKRKIISWCEINRERLIRILEEDNQKVAPAVAKVAGREALSIGAKYAAKKAATTTTTTTTRYFFGLFSRTTTTQVVKVATASSTRCLKGATPVGFVADIAQVALEAKGYKKAGKTVGASGNMVSGAMVGFALGGPIGAGVGTVAGLGVWKGGEVVGNVVGNAIASALS